ncbi:hypothetical protein FOCC_FOCC011742 [Frankliniella occidentalis]|nr:hypothetical protein FOCC_FOCC011742 [Frankliniella occidentalis]
MPQAGNFKGGGNKNPSNGNPSKKSSKNGNDQVGPSLKRSASNPLDQQSKKQHQETLVIDQRTKYRYYEEDTGPEYVVLVESKEENIGNFHALAIARCLRDAKVPYSTATAAGKNKLRLIFDAGSKANEFLDSKLCEERRWTAYIPTSRITRMGVVRGLGDLFSDTELAESASTEEVRVLQAFRLNRRTPENTWEPSGAWRLTFEGQTLPKYIYLEGLRIKVEPYVPPVKRCTKCQLFGHISKDCRGKARCGKCGNSHMDEECPEEKIFCIYCKTEDHSAEDREKCNRWAKEKQVKKHMAEKNLSYAKALQIQKQTNKQDKKLEDFPLLQGKKPNPPVTERTEIPPPVFTGLVVKILAAVKAALVPILENLVQKIISTFTNSSPLLSGLSTAPTSPDISISVNQEFQKILPGLEFTSADLVWDEDHNTLQDDILSEDPKANYGPW